MPIGGGTFTVQNKILPGAYINFVSLGSVVKMGTRGVAALPLELNWGPENKVFSVYAEDFNKNALSVFGYTDLFADLVIIGAVLLVSCKYIKEAFVKFNAILNAGTSDAQEKEKEVIDYE